MFGGATYNNLTGKELYDLDTARIKQAEPTESQLARGKRIFWWVVAVSICLMVHMAFTTKGFLWHWLQAYIVVFIFPLLFISYYSGILSFSFWEYRIAISTDSFYKSLQNYIYIFIIFWNLCVQGDKIRFLILIFTYLLFCIPIIATIVFETTGLYLNISSYVSILDITPSIWEHSGGNMSMPVYSFVNTINIFLYYGIYLLLFLLLKIVIYDVYLWYKKFKRLILDPECKSIIYSFSEKYKEKLSNRFLCKRIFGAVLLLIFMLVWLIIPTFMFFEFRGSGLWNVYEFSYEHGAYSIFHTLVFFMLFLFCVVALIPVNFRAILECIYLMLFLKRKGFSYEYKIK